MPEHSVHLFQPRTHLLLTIENAYHPQSKVLIININQAHEKTKNAEQKNFHFLLMLSEFTFENNQNTHLPTSPRNLLLTSLDQLTLG